MAGVTNPRPTRPHGHLQWLPQPCARGKLASDSDSPAASFELGIAQAGRRRWLAYGYGFPPTCDRLKALHDGLEVITRIWLRAALRTTPLRPRRRRRERAQGHQRRGRRSSSRKRREVTALAAATPTSSRCLHQPEEVAEAIRDQVAVRKRSNRDRPLSVPVLPRRGCKGAGSFGRLHRRAASCLSRLVRFPTRYGPTSRSRSLCGGLPPPASKWPSRRSRGAPMLPTPALFRPEPAPSNARRPARRRSRPKSVAERTSAPAAGQPSPVRLTRPTIAH